jgi:hypothetical protein
MTTKPEVLLWPGAESMAKLERALQERRAVELVLSAGLHNAFFNRFKADAPPDPEVRIDVQGGAELLGQLAGIAGLEPLGQLEQVLRDGGWRVAITSPTPQILLSPS